MKNENEKCKLPNPFGKQHFACGILAAALIVIAAAQDQPPRPTFRTEANYVRVDVYPTKDGGPVPDLTQDDFEILDNGVRQTVEQFERIVIRPAGPQDARVEPNNTREMRAMLESSRARVFVLFLDSYHVPIGGSYDIRKPLIEALDQVIGADDLVGVMTPYMSPGDMAFARKTTTIAGMLTRYWTWGTADRINPPDPEDEMYDSCYPNVAPGSHCADQNGVAAEMTVRRHEKRTLDALQDLVRFLRGVREERKAVIAISTGWLEYRPDYNLARALKCHGTTDAKTMGVDPRSGKINLGDPDPNAPSEQRCGIDRLNLAQIDNEKEFREILDAANAANASFYPVDPRGLPGSTTAAEAAVIRARLESLHTIAVATDGLAIVNSNDIAGGLRRMIDDLSSYYLLGYYASTKLDGKFHAITVRVKRSGVAVRARRGYLAATLGSANAATATAAATAAPAKVDAELAAVASAIAPLADYTREVPLRLQAAIGWKPGDASTPFVVVEGELNGTREFEYLWQGGALASVELAPPDGPTLMTAPVTIAASTKSFRVVLASSSPLAPGEYILRVGVRSSTATVPTRDTLHITVPPRPRADGAIWFRRGPSTGNRETPTADLRFRRTEQVKVEIPTTAEEARPARLMDRAGKALAVPVTTALRTDADGSRWTTAQLALAPLAVGDYVIELADGNNRILAALRVVP